MRQRERAAASTPSPRDELQRLLRVFTLVFAVVALSSYAISIRIEAPLPRDFRDFVLGTDFLNTWMMGRATLTDAQPERNYRMPHYNAQLHAMLGPDYPLQQWSYPPPYVMAAAVFGALPYLIALAVLTVAGIAGLVWMLRRLRVRWGDCLTVLCSPAGLLGVLCGQISLLATAAQLYCLQRMDRHPWRAGVVLGLLSVKPQLGLIYPFFLIATRRWKTFIAAALTVMLLVMLSLMVLGSAAWLAFLHEGLPAQSLYALENMAPIITAMVPTLYVDLRAFGLGHEVALMAQIMVACGVIAALFTPRFRALEPVAQWLFLALGGVLVTPYAMGYDWLFVSVAIVLYADACAVSRAGAWLLGLVFWLPLLHIMLMLAGISGSAILPLLLLGWLLRAPRKIL